MKQKSSISSEQLCSWEKQLIEFIYQDKWQQAWDGQTIPKDVFKSFCAHARRLSDAFTLDRSLLKENYFNKKESGHAYLLYFHLANVVRITSILEDFRDQILDRQVSNNETKILRVLDLGSGWGASAWALEWMIEHSNLDYKIELILSDSNQNVLHQSKALCRKMKFKHVTVKTEHLNIGDSASLKIIKNMRNFDLIMSANVLNEIPLETQSQLTSFFKRLWFDALTQEGHMLMIEPALKTLSKKLTQYRDEWLGFPDAKISLPCTHCKACPMNNDVDDWCHFETQWDTPEYRKKIEKFLGHKEKSLKAAYFILSKGERKESTQHRVISNELKLSKGLTIILCTPEGKVGVVLERDKKRKKIIRGDVHSLEGTSEKRKFILRD